MGTEDHLFTETREDGKWVYTYPDTINLKKEPFATVIPTRSPTFKVHRTEGIANSALAYHKRGAKYEFINGVWTKTGEVKDDADNCDKCSAILTDTDRHAPSYYSRNTKGARLRSPLHKGSNIFAPFLCLNCYKEENEAVENKAKAKAWAAEQKRRAAFDAKN